MTEQMQPEFPYVLTIETAPGQFTTVPIAFLTAREIENFLQNDFKRLVEAAGLTGVRVHIERAPTADYDKVLVDVAGHLRAVATRAA